MLALGLLIALAATTADNVGVVLQASQARRCSPDLARSMSLILRLARMRLWLFGMVLLVAGVALQATALGYAPLTLVQATVGFGIIVLVIASGRLLGQRLDGPRLLAAALLVAAIVGVALLSRRPAHHATDWVALVVITLVAGAVAAVPYAMRHEDPVLLAVGAGAAYAGVAALLKAAADAGTRGSWGALPVLLALLAALGLAGFVLEETALTRGPPTAVDPIIMLFQIGVPLVLGPLVFGDPMPGGARGILLALCFSAAVIAAVVLSRAPALGGLHEGAPGQLQPS